MLPFHVFANQNPRRSSSLAPAALRPRRFRHNEEKLVTRHDSRPVLSCVYALFHFPYPVTLAFATLKKTAGGVPTIPILELNTLLSAQSILVLSFHALTNCPFSIPFILTFMHRMGGVGGTPNIQTCQHSNLARIFISRRPDRKNNPLAPPERRKEVQQLLPGDILFVQQLHPVFRFRARNNFGPRFHQIAQQLAAGGARRNSHPRIVGSVSLFRKRRSCTRKVSRRSHRDSPTGPAQTIPASSRPRRFS